MDFKLEELKQILLQQLDVFLAVCNTYNLKYTMLGGTLLGAVRHGGMIPWDDDIDIGMPRPDYEKLMSIAEEAFPSKYKLVSIHNDKDYYLPFAKLYDMETSLIEREDIYYYGGVFIDIFPLDGIPDANGIKHLEKARKKINTAIYLRIAQREHPHGLKHLCRWVLYKLLYGNSYKVLKKCDEVFFMG